MDMEMKELWDSACAILKSHMNQVIYNTWIVGNLTPKFLEENRLILQITMENMRGNVMNFHHASITEAVSQAANRRLEVQILTKAELEKYTPEHSDTDANALPDTDSMPLNPKYTFDTFVVGSGNRFVHAAAVAVAESPANAYNPLFIYGGVGLGKTHLMHAIAHYILDADPNKKILYVSGETFTNDLIRAIQQNRNIQFRNRFRNVDVLIVDDIQFIAGKESTQEEFFHTFNSLHTAGKQIILSSDRPPHEISRLEERLSSRFAWGLLADIKKPDLETRTAILRKKAESENITVADDVLEDIAKHIDTNIRELEGCLTRLVAYARMSNKPITVQLCKEALSDLYSNPARKEVTPQLIMETVADFYTITVNDLISNSRRREFSVPRQIAMFLIRDMTNLSLPQIGQLFGRDHTTIMHGCDKIAVQIKEASSDMNKIVNDVKSLITEGK